MVEKSGVVVVVDVVVDFEFILNYLGIGDEFHDGWHEFG